MGSQWGTTGGQGRKSTRYQRQHMLDGSTSSYSREVRSASCGPPPTEPGSTRQAAPDVLTWVVFKQSLGWTFPICTGTTAVHLSVTQSTNDSEAASSDATTTITTRNI